MYELECVKKGTDERYCDGMVFTFYAIQFKIQKFYVLCRE